MRKWEWAGAVALAISVGMPAWAEKQPDVPAIPPAIVALQKSLHPQTGDIRIPQAKAVMHLGDRYYFLPAAEAKRVLVEAWGNPPDSVGDVLGMVFPADKTFLDNVWGAVVTFRDTGYVSDKDAKTQDYGTVLQQMREGEDKENGERQKAGFPAVHLVGWAQPPAYDPATHALIWARDIGFSGQAVDTLNFDVRLLGRSGVLSLNMVSDMQHLPEVREAAQAFGNAATFERGSTYADYDSSTDKDAGYGLAGLVAAGAGVAAAKKLGLLAIVLGFGKKALVLLAIAGAAILRFAKRLFGKRSEEA